MRFIVGEGQTGSGVFLLSDGAAVNLTALDPAVGPDLISLITGRVDAADILKRARCADRRD